MYILISQLLSAYTSRRYDSLEDTLVCSLIGRYCPVQRSSQLQFACSHSLLHSSSISIDGGTAALRLRRLGGGRSLISSSINSSSSCTSCCVRRCHRGTTFKSVRFERCESPVRMRPGESATSCLPRCPAVAPSTLEGTESRGLARDRSTWSSCSRVGGCSSFVAGTAGA